MSSEKYREYESPRVSRGVNGAAVRRREKSGQACECVQNESEGSGNECARSWRTIQNSSVVTKITKERNSRAGRHLFFHFPFYDFGSPTIEEKGTRYRRGYGTKFFTREYLLHVWLCAGIQCVHPAKKKILKFFSEKECRAIHNAGEYISTLGTACARVNFYSYISGLWEERNFTHILFALFHQLSLFFPRQNIQDSVRLYGPEKFHTLWEFIRSTVPLIDAGWSGILFQDGGRMAVDLIRVEYQIYHFTERTCTF